jgi:membrane protease YdiL (CAAX protease family)
VRFSLATFAIVLAYTWVIAPIAPAWAAAVAGVVVLVLTIAHAAKAHEWGLQWRPFAAALGWSAVFTAAVAIGLYVTGDRLGTWHGDAEGLRRLPELVAWGFGQQFALQTMFLREAQAVASRRGGIWLAAILFAALHLPNPFLTIATGAAALAWCSIYDRHPNLLPLALSHAVLTLVVLFAFDDVMTGRLRVGVGYLSLQ